MTTRFRRLPPVLACALLAASIVSIGRAETPTASPNALPNDERTIAHVLNRIAFGARPGDIDRVRKMGLESYIDAQLRPERVNDGDVEARLAGLKTLTMSSADIAREYFVPAQLARRRQQQANGRPQQSDPNMVAPPNRPDGPPPNRPQGPPPEEVRRQRVVIEELNEQKIVRAVYSERQLQEVLVDFWFNHFNVFGGKGVDRILLTEYEREAIRPHVLGRFRDLLEATAKSPAMLFYLDNWLSADPDGPHLDRGGRPGRRALARPAPQNQMKRGLNENYARELMELHTLGVDGGYTQKDIVEVARAFTGWTMMRPGPQMDRMGARRSRFSGPVDPGELFFFDPAIHDPGEKTVLGQKIKAGGMDDGRRVLDILAKHPSTAAFIATKLARRFVADEPPKALVARAAARFKETDGDIREVVRTIITSPEFLSADVHRAKVKTPFEFVVSALRTTGADVRNAAVVAQTLQQLGQPLYMCQPPTGYSDKAEAWVNSGALINRMNFAMQVAGGRSRGIAMDYRTALGAGTDTRDLEKVRSAVIDTLLHDQVSDATRATIERATDVTQIAALTLGSPEFQRR